MENVEDTLQLAKDELEKSDASLRRERHRKHRAQLIAAVITLAFGIVVGGKEFSPPPTTTAAVVTTTTQAVTTTLAPTTTAPPQIGTAEVIVAPTTTTPPTTVAPVVVRGVPTCVNPNPDGVSKANAYMGPLGADQIKAMVCGG